MSILAISPRQRRLLQLGSVLASAWYALWACAPAATMRPMTLDMDTPNEFGLAGSVTQFVGAPETCADDLFGCSAGFDGQIWYQRRFLERFSFGGTIFGGESSNLGAGVFGRFHWLETDRFRLGTDLEGGFLWGAVGVPFSVRLVGNLWVYTNPSVGMRLAQSARFPLGVAYGINEHWWIQAEGAYGFNFLDSPFEPLRNDLWTAAVSGSYRF